MCGAAFWCEYTQDFRSWWSKKNEEALDQRNKLIDQNT
jgi:hypothetical protein